MGKGRPLKEIRDSLLCVFVLYMKVLNIHANYSLVSEEGQSKPSNLGQTEAQQWNQMSS